MDKRNYSGYANPKLNNSNKIFTREEIAKMPRAEFAANEKAIDYQLGVIGIPSESDLKESCGVVHVSAYTKDDGTDVREHYRSAPIRQSNGDYQGMSPDEDGNPNPDNDPNSDQNQNPPNPDPNNPEGKVLKGKVIIVEFPKSPDNGKLPPDGQGEPQPKPEPEPTPEPEPSPAPDPVDEEVNNDLKKIEQIMQLMSSIKKLTSQKSGGQNGQYEGGVQSSGAVSNYSHHLDASKGNLKNAIDKAKVSLSKQKTNLDKLENEIATNNNQSVHKKLWSKYTAKKESYQQNMAKINSYENMAENEQFEEGVNNYGGGGGNANQAESRNNSNPLQGYATEKPYIADPYQNIASMPSYKQTYFDNIKPNVRPYNEEINSNSNITENTNAQIKAKLNAVNYKFNIENNYRPLTYEFMKHSINKLEDLSSTPDCKLLDQTIDTWDKNGNIKRLKVLQYSPNSRISRAVKQSVEFREFLAKLKTGSAPNSISFDKTQDLHLSLGKVTVNNVKLNSKGHYSVVISDIYDFHKLDVSKYLFKDFYKTRTNAINNIAYYLQNFALLENYIFIIEILE